MALYKRGTVWWVRFTDPTGREVRRSAQTRNRREAEEFHDLLKSRLWREARLGERPRRKWQEAVARWLTEKAHKASIQDDVRHLRWLHPYLYDRYLDQIDRNLLDEITRVRQAEGVANASVNRVLQAIRAILRAAERDWEWIDRAPVVRLLPEPKRRIRWLMRSEAERLLKLLPHHLAEMAEFTLATGLRERNVTRLEWTQIDLEKRQAWIHPDQAKARRAIAVPLNGEAIEVLHRQRGKHSTRVFTYRSRPVNTANTKAWRAALRKAGIDDFRWHDLRHTWASWHVQNGTPLHVLQELGGWSSAEMVGRYAHLSVEHLAEYANRLARTRTIDQVREPRAIYRTDSGTAVYPAGAA